MENAIILLNYNSEELIIRHYNNYLSSDLIDRFVLMIVDNSPGILEEFIRTDDNVVYIESQINLGYARGNNLGLRKAQEMGLKRAFIFNPDILIDDFIMLDSICDDVQRDLREVAIVYFQVRGQNVYYFRPYLVEILFPFIKKLYSKNKRIKNSDLIYHGSGSCLLINIEALSSLGFFSEETFLFYEEAILAERLKSTHYETILYANHEFVHLHSYSINKSFKSRKFEFMKDSLLFYLIEYRKLPRYLANIVAQINIFFMKVNSLIKS